MEKKTDIIFAVLILTILLIMGVTASYISIGSREAIAKLTELSE